MMTLTNIVGVRIAFNNLKKHPYNRYWWWLYNTRNDHFHFAITSVRPRLVSDQYGWWFAIVRYETGSHDFCDVPWIEWNNDARKLVVKVVQR